MGLSKFNKNVENIIELDDNPNEGATPLTSSELKEKFDQAGKDIKDYINNTLTSELDTTVSGINDSISDLDTNLSEKIGNLDNLTTTNKSNIVSAINEVNYDSGWINITSSRGTWNYLRCRKSGKKVLLEGNGTIKFDPNNKFVGTIPSGYRVPGTQTKYIISAVQGSRLARIFVAADGHDTNPNKIGIDWIKRIDNANDDTSDSFWIDFRIEYYVD